MKRIVMTTETQETVTMGDAGQFRTGAPVVVEDDVLAESLLNQGYPKFEEAPGEEQITASTEKLPKKVK